MNFPIYRKYSHGRTYFKILSENAFEELNIMGRYYTVKGYNIQNFADRILIKDMIENIDMQWNECTEKEFLEKLSFCLDNLEKL